MAASSSRQFPLDQEYDYDYPGSSYLLVTQPAKGTGQRELAYQSHTGVLKLDITPFDKLDFKTGVYIYRARFDGSPGISKFHPPSGF